MRADGQKVFLSRTQNLLGLASSAQPDLYICQWLKSLKSMKTFLCSFFACRLDKKIYYWTYYWTIIIIIIGPRFMKYKPMKTAVAAQQYKTRLIIQKIESLNPPAGTGREQMANRYFVKASKFSWPGKFSLPLGPRTRVGTWVTPFFVG
jgi:hypothetical protein